MPDRGIFVLEDGSNTGTTAKQARRALAGLHARATGGGARPGVLIDDMSAVVVGKANMSYDVRPAVFVTKFSDANGPTDSASEATVNVVTTAAPGANSRIDAVYAIQRLLTADGGSGTTNVLEFGVVQGSVAASPIAPAVPAGSVRLADVTVTSGVTATSGLTYEAPADLWTVANGGLIPASKGSRQFSVWNGTSYVTLYASESMTKYAINLTNFAGDSLFISRRPITGTGTNAEMVLYGRLQRQVGAFSLSGSWVDLPGSVSVPSNMRPDNGDANVYASGLHLGHSPMSLRLNTTTGVVSIRSQYATLSIGATDFFSFDGAHWTRGF